MQQHPQMMMVIPQSTREAMESRIQHNIRNAVLSSGRGATDLHKYARNIENTAFTQCQGDMARYEQVANDMVNKLITSSNAKRQQQQQQGMQIPQPNAMQPQLQQQHAMTMQQQGMQGTPQYGMAPQYPQMTALQPAAQPGMQFQAQPGMYTQAGMTQNRAMQMQGQQLQPQQQAMMMQPQMQQQQQQQAPQQMQQQQLPQQMQQQQQQQQQQQPQQTAAQQMVFQQAANSAPAAAAAGPSASITHQESVSNDPSFRDFLNILVEQSPQQQQQQQPSQQQPMQPQQQQQQQQMPGQVQLQQAPGFVQMQAPQQGMQQQQQQQQQVPQQQQMGPPSGGFTALLQSNTSAPAQQQGAYGVGQQVQGMANTGQKMMGQQQGMTQLQQQQQQQQQMYMQQQTGMQPMQHMQQQQQMMYVQQPQQVQMQMQPGHMAGGSYVAAVQAIPTGGAAMGPAQHQQQQQQQQQQRTQQQQQQQQQPAVVYPGGMPGFMAMPPPQGMQAQQQLQQQSQQQQGVQVQVAAPGQQQQQQVRAAVMPNIGAVSAGPGSGSAAANSNAIAAAAAAAHMHNQNAAFRAPMPQQQQVQQHLHQQQQVVTAAVQSHLQQQQQQQHMQSMGPSSQPGSTMASIGTGITAATAAGAPVQSGNAGATTAAAPAADGQNQAAAAAAAAAAAHAAQKANLMQQIAPLSPRTRTNKYYAQVDDLRNKYAKDLHDLVQLLQVQRVTQQNQARIQQYVNSTNNLLSVLNSQKTAATVSPEQFLQLLGVKRQCEKMVSQLHALRSRKVVGRNAAASGASGVPGQQYPMGPPAAMPSTGPGAVQTPDEYTSRPLPVPSPQPGTAPSPAPGIGAAATPPIGTVTVGPTQLIKPDLPQAPVLPEVRSGDATAKAATAATATAATAVAADVKPGMEIAAAARAPAPGEIAAVGGFVVACAAADTPLGKLRLALTSASKAQQHAAAEQQALALEWRPHSAATGPLPSLSDFEAAVAANSRTAEGAEASDSSVATVDAHWSDQPYMPIDSRTIRLQLPDGYQLPSALNAAEAAVGEQSRVKAEPLPQDGDVVMGEAAADGVTDSSSGGMQLRKRQVKDECKQIEADMQGCVKLYMLPAVVPGSQDAAPAAAEGGAMQLCIECTAGASTAAAAATLDATGKAAGSIPGNKWKRMKLMLRETYPQLPPVVMFEPGVLLELPNDQQQPGATAAASVGTSDVQQQVLAEEAWSELQAALWEDPVVDLKGVTQHWCQAVTAVALQHGQPLA